MKVELSESQVKMYLHDQAFFKSINELELLEYEPKDVVRVIEELCNVNTELLKSYEKLLLKGINKPNK